MNSNTKYDILIIGGGISACVFASEYLKCFPEKKIAIIEAGRGLGGRSSTRNSKKFKGWKINHGSPNLNICNERNNKLIRKFIAELVINKVIENDDSEFIHLNRNNKSELSINTDFYRGNSYLSLSSMRDLSEKIIKADNISSKIEFFFENLILDFSYKKKIWHLISQNGNTFKSEYLICSSNLVLHKRSKEIFNLSRIPIRNAIPENKDFKIDELIKILDKQSYIPRLTFLIYTKYDYQFKDIYRKKFRYFFLNKELENKYKFERVIFQRQENNRLGIVVHIKNKDFIEKVLSEGEKNFKKIVLSLFNQLFEGNPLINKLSDIDGISIMRWRASQPLGSPVPLSLQLCRNYKIGFCGDWFEGEGFGRIEGAIFSALKLAEKFNSPN